MLSIVLLSSETLSSGILAGVADETGMPISVAWAGLLVGVAITTTGSDDEIFGAFPVLVDFEADVFEESPFLFTATRKK